MESIKKEKAVFEIDNNNKTSQELFVHPSFKQKESHELPPLEVGGDLDALVEEFRSNGLKPENESVQGLDRLHREGGPI